MKFEKAYGRLVVSNYFFGFGIKGRGIEEMLEFNIPN